MSSLTINGIGPWTLDYTPISLAYMQAWYGDCGGKTVLENSSRYRCVDNKISEVISKTDITLFRVFSWAYTGTIKAFNTVYCCTR